MILKFAYLLFRLSFFSIPFTFVFKNGRPAFFVHSYCSTCIYFIIIERYEEEYRCEEVVGEDLMVFSHNVFCEFYHY